MFLLCFRVGRKCSHYAEFIWEQVHVTICCDETQVDLILLIIKAGVLVLRCKFNILEGYLYVYIAYIKTMSVAKDCKLGWALPFMCCATSNTDLACPQFSIGKWKLWLISLALGRRYFIIVPSLAGRTFLDRNKKYLPCERRYLMAESLSYFKSSCFLICTLKPDIFSLLLK